MDLRVARGILDVIRTERARRAQVRRDEDEEYSGELWVEEDVPFVNELCLTLLVAVWHQVERELVYRAARVTVEGRPIPWATYLESVRNTRESARKKGRELFERLKVNVPDWLETLRLLVNCYKHEPSVRPDPTLLRHLRMPLEPTEHLVKYYAPLPESYIFLKGLAASLGMDQKADYPAVAEELILRVERFMADIENTTPLSPIERGPISLSEFEG